MRQGNIAASDAIEKFEPFLLKSRVAHACAAVASAGSVSTGLGVGVGALVVAGSVAINFLELFVAFLQAFIFTFLTTLFIGMSVVFHHGDHGDKHHDPHDVIEVNPDQVARAV